MGKAEAGEVQNKMRGLPGSQLNSITLVLNTPPVGLKRDQEQKGSPRETYYEPSAGIYQLPGYEHSQATPLYPSMASLSPTMASGALITYAMPVLYLRSLPCNIPFSLCTHGQ